MTNRSIARRVGDRIAAGLFAAVFSTVVTAPANGQTSSDLRSEQDPSDLRSGHLSEEQERLGQADDRDGGYASTDEDGHVASQEAGEAYHDESRCEARNGGSHATCQGRHEDPYEDPYEDQGAYADGYDDPLATEYGSSVGVYAPGYGPSYGPSYTSYGPSYGRRTVIYFGGSSRGGRFHSRHHRGASWYGRGGYDGRPAHRSHLGNGSHRRSGSYRGRDSHRGSRSQESRNHDGSRSRSGSRSERSRR